MTVKAEATELFSWGTEGESSMGENESTPVAQVVAMSSPEAVQSAAVEAATVETATEPDLPPVVKVARQADGEFAVVDADVKPMEKIGEAIGRAVDRVAAGVRSFAEGVSEGLAKSAAERDHEATVKRLAVDFAMAGLAAAKAKAAAKEAAEKQDAALTLLQGAINESPEEMPLFDREPMSEPKPTTVCVAPPNAAPLIVTTSPSPSLPSSDQVAYDALLRSAKLADLTLTRDGKKVSLKGTVEKLADQGISTIYGWEKLRADVSTNQPGAAYPPRIRRDDLEEAVAEWIAKNSLSGLAPKKADPPQQPIPAPAVAQSAPPAPKAGKQTVEPEKPADAKPEAQAAAVAPVAPAAPAAPAPKTAAEILESQSLLALAMPRDVVLALEDDGITNLAKLQQVVAADTFSAKFKPADRTRIAGRLKGWIENTLPSMVG